MQTPAGFNEKRIQGAYAWIDYCYFVERNAGDDSKIETIKHAMVEQLSLKTAQAYPDGAPAQLDTTQFPPLQKEIVELFRQGMALDEFYKTKNNIFTDKSLFEYEEELRQKLNGNLEQPTIYVRRAINLKGEFGIGVVITKELHNHFSCLNDPDFHLRIEGEGKSRKGDLYVVYVNDANIPKLQAEFEFAMHPEVRAFATNIQAVRNSGVELADFKATALQNIFKTVRNHSRNGEYDNKNSPNPVIAKHFSQVAADIANGSLTTIKQVTQSNEELNKKLYGKKPTNAVLKMVIGGAFGLLLGGIAGTLIAVGLTLGSGGVAAIPSTLVGLAMAVEGAKIGAAAAVAIGSVGLTTAIIGGLCLFDGKADQASFANKKQQYENTPIAKDIKRQEESNESLSKAFKPR